MAQYRITGKGDGVEYGIYEGTTPEEAVQALLDEADSSDTPQMDRWIVQQVE
jgi:hypothetical protein